MGWLNDLLGTLKPGAKPARRSIGEVEKALAKLASKREEARTAISDLMKRREQLLLQDGSDALIAKADAEADRHRLTLERVEKAEPLLLAELAALRTEQKRQRWADLRARYNKEARAYAGIFRQAVEKQAE
jgi:hypothetical protein